MLAELKTIDLLKKEFDALIPGDEGAYIEFYERNKLSIDNIDPTVCKEHCLAKMRLKCEYGLNLIKVGRYTQGVAKLEKAITLFENVCDDSYTHSNKSCYYEHLLWTYGYGLYQLKLTTKSKRVFDKLVKLSPENDKYLQWYNCAKAENINKVSRIFWVLAGFGMVLELVFLVDDDTTLNTIVNIACLFCLGIAIALEFWMHVLKQKKTSTV